MKTLLAVIISLVCAAVSPGFAEPTANGCKLPSPHFERIKGKCVPSCGLLLGKKKGVMVPKKCPSGMKYAGFTWEQSKFKSVCCVAGGTSVVDTVGSGCDLPPLHHINVHVRQGNGARVIADATPIVCSTDAGTKFERYCQNTMKDPNRSCCPARPEGDPMRVACELVLLGKDKKDNVGGPRWSFSGNGWVDKRDDNPFLAYASGHGTVYACSNVVNVCGSAAVNVK